MAEAMNLLMIKLEVIMWIRIMIWCLRHRGGSGAAI